MPHKKKKIFTKNNSVKFLLLHGNEGATNADGQTLENVLVPVSANYKPGSSLLASKFAEFCNISPAGDDKDANLENIIEGFDEFSNDDDEDEITHPKMKKRCCNEKSFASNNVDFVLEDLGEKDFSDESNQFSDASSCDDFGEYSLTSATTNCPENIKILNDRFEKLLLEEYDEDQIGALEDEEICGNLTVECERVKDLIDASNEKGEQFDIGVPDKSIKEKILQYAETDTDEKYVEVVIEKPIEFDCESILSTYSNIYNHPTVIKEESKIQKIKIPSNPLKKLTKKDLKQIPAESMDEESDDNISVATTINIRPKGETREQKRERKSLFKEAKRESRILKKENKIAFKEEKKLQVAQAINVRRNQGIRLL